MMEREPMNYDPMDERLGTASQEAMRMVVRGMPEDTLSMAWRSSLNEKLIAEATAKQKKRRVAWILRPALGLGLACTLAIIATFHGQGVSAKDHGLALGSGSLEAALVNVHHQSTLASEVAGVGVSPSEMVAYSVSGSASSSASTTGPRWSEEDLDSL